MSFPRYERYSRSDIPWIEALPAGWKTQRLKTTFQLMARPVRDEDEIITAFRDGDVTLRNKRRQEEFTNALQEIGYQGIRVDDLVIHAMDAFAGAVGISDSDGSQLRSILSAGHGAQQQGLGITGISYVTWL
jgi:type I restriction enzyme, S subunit